MNYQARRYHYRSLLWVSAAAFLSARVSSKIAGTTVAALDSSSSTSSNSFYNTNKPTTCSSASSPLISTGLVNLANTCYLNSQLQCAFHIPRVRNLILSPVMQSSLQDNDEHSVETSSTISSSSSELSTENDDPVAEDLQKQQQQPESLGLQALRLVFQDMVNAASINGMGSPSLNTAAAVSPRAFATALSIPVLEQQDAQEFWKLLLPELNVPSLTDLYQGAFQDYIVALDGSGRERRREEPFLDLSLDVITTVAGSSSSSSSSSVVLSLQQMFGQPELLRNADGNGWRPETGADKVDAHKGSLLRTQGLPSILQLHLKRFNYDWNTETMNKINDPFTFPKELDLSYVIKDEDDNNKSNDPELKIYDLQAIVVHMGIYGQGHYYSYVRPDVRNDDWYRFDDEQVTRVTYQDVVADATGGKQQSSDDTALEPKQQHQQQGSGPLGFLRALLFRGKNSPGCFGYGGPTSNAYVIQYVRRCDIPMLYDDDNGNFDTKLS